MILCEGGCKRIFHMDCVGLSALPDGASSKWACSRCVSRLRSCSICDGVERAKNSTSMVRCSVSHCGKWFHSTCIETRYGGLRENGVCPRHTCGISGCTSPITDECYFCILCLNAYHLKCLPEEVEVICENTCLCLNHQFSLGGATGNRFADRLLSVEIGRNLAPCKSKKSTRDESEQVSIASTASTPDCSAEISSIPRSMRDTEIHQFFAKNFTCPYKVITNVSDEHIVLSDDDELVATTKPKESSVDTSGLNFVRLRANEWLCPRPRRGKEEEDFAGVCSCVGECDNDCTNCVCMVQCEFSNCRPTSELKKKGGSDFKSFQCGNKPFFKGNGTANSGKYMIVSAGDKGMGVMAKNDIKAGEFIIEYIGEVLSVDGWAERQKLEPRGSSKHFYVMELDSDHLVDASRKGNDSRLINHSCDPNLETQKWTVYGESRIGLFAIRDIRKGEEMTFNYQFETFASKPFKCICGTAKCSGWIGGKAKKSAEAKEREQGKRERDILLPIPMLQNVSAVDIPIAATRSDGTRKRDEEVSLEEISACKDRIDYYLQYIWSGRVSGEEWASAGRACATLYPERTGQAFNPAAVLALSVTKIEANFIKERNLLVLRQLNKARRDLARRFYVWPDTIPAVERVLEGNWISDDICVRCRRTGNLVWCKSCVRSFHQCCVAYGDKLTSDPLTGEHAFTCRRCRRVASAGAQPPIRLPKENRVAHWKERRRGYWEEVVLPTLYAKAEAPAGSTAVAKKRKGN